MFIKRKSQQGIEILSKKFLHLENIISYQKEKIL